MQLSSVLRTWRTTNKISVRAAAKQIGIHYTTLARIESGETMDGKTLATILRWLMGVKA